MLPEKMLQKLNVNFAGAVSEFERILKNFQARRMVYRTLFRGGGLEFDSYRNFGAEDDAAMIDWKASMRANTLLAKQYVEERNLDIYFVVDASSSMLFGSGNKLKAEYAAEIVSAFSHLILVSNDRPGVILFSGEVRKLLKPSRSNNQFHLIVDALSRTEFYGGKFDLRSEVSYLMKTIVSPYSVVILVSDFISLRDSKTELKRLSTRFETFALMVRDPLDNSISKSGYQMVLQDSEFGRRILVDPALISEKYSELAMQRKKEAKDILTGAGIDVLEMRTDEPFPVKLAGFLKSRATEARR